MYLDYAAQNLSDNSIDDMSKESILYILEKCINPIIKDLKSKMDNFTASILIPALYNPNPYV
jgi:hypothetical protein